MPTSDRPSVTTWIGQLRAGHHSAAQQLWERYFDRLVELARRRLHGVSRRASDEDDIALSAFTSFCIGVSEGRFPQLRDRNDLWKLLVVITARKIARQAKHDRRLKRGGPRVRGESALLAHKFESAGTGLDQIVGTSPTPDFVAEVTEEYRRLLDLLGDAQLCRIAVWKMEGFTNDEIAAKLGCVPRTVERKLRVIRSKWSARRHEPRP